MSTLNVKDNSNEKHGSSFSLSPVWILRSNDNESKIPSATTPLLEKNLSVDEDDPDTDLETDRLLGHQRSEYEEKKFMERIPRLLQPTSLSKITTSSDTIQQLPKVNTVSTNNNLLPISQQSGINSLLTKSNGIASPNNSSIDNHLIDIDDNSSSSPEHSDISLPKQETLPQTENTSMKDTDPKSKEGKFLFSCT